MSADKTLLREVEYLLSLDPSVRGADAHVCELLQALRADNERLRMVCFEAGHFPNPMGHSVVGCPICEFLSAAPEGATDGD